MRRRLASALPGFALFVALGALGTRDTWDQPWLFVGLGMALSATFLEPYFSSPRSAIANAAGGVGACLGADHGSVGGLWLALGAFLGFVFLAGVVASITPDGRANSVARHFSSRFGRAVPVGTSVLAMIVLTEAELNQDGFQELAAATTVLVLSTSFDWFGIWSRVVDTADAAVAVSAVGPRMLLIAGASPDFQEGQSLDVSSTTGGSTVGTVVARLPHADGVRYRVALAGDWAAVCREFPSDLSVREHDLDDAPVGAVAEGTTQRTLEFEPFCRLDVGDPLLLRPDGQVLLYQVARLRLDATTWSGSNVVVPKATAHLVGRPTDSHVRSVSYLPDAHEPVRRADDLTGDLSAAYYEIGHIKGTNVPIGLRTDEQRRGHIAILGMSGMGKTAVAHRVCSTLGNDHVVVAMDTTGEYQGRLGFPLWAEGDFSTCGHFVQQPAGDPPFKAKEFIEQCMKAGFDEYNANQTPQRRVILLEEAHTFLPEWNVALRSQQEHVAFSTRMIMQARKFGLTFIVVSQRTAVVSKSALSQCENYVILKTLDHTGLEYLESLVGPAMRDAIPALQRFEAMCVGPAFNAEEPVIVTLSAPNPVA